MEARGAGANRTSAVGFHRRRTSHRWRDRATLDQRCSARPSARPRQFSNSLEGAVISLGILWRLEPIYQAQRFRRCSQFLPVFQQLEQMFLDIDLIYRGSQGLQSIDEFGEFLMPLEVA